MGGNTSKGQRVVEDMVGQCLQVKKYVEVDMNEFKRRMDSGNPINCFVRQAKYETWKGTKKGKADFLVMRKRPKKINGGLAVNFIQIEAKHQDSSGSTADKIPAVFEDFDKNSLNVDCHILFLSGSAWKRRGKRGPSAEARAYEWAVDRAEEMTKSRRRYFSVVYQDGWADESKKVL